MNERITLVQDASTPWETDDEAVDYANDPKAFILKRCKRFMSLVRTGSNNILVATYFPPEATKIKGPGGKMIDFVIPKSVTNEAKWQSRVGLLIAKGPMAWMPDERVSFGGSQYKIGDWVCYDRQDGRQMAVNRIHCRRLKDVDVWGDTDEPYLVY